jgi:hypothetical protein
MVMIHHEWTQICL